MNCQICMSPMSKPVKELFALPTVTSDCRSWPDGKSVEVCYDCGVMHCVTNKDFSGIYDDYVSYPEPTGRTKKILDSISHNIPSPKKILDVGCGEGAGVKIMEQYFPNAQVYGYEPTICAERPKDKFDLITLFHVLEHVEDLHEMLSYVKSSLADGGHVLIQVPYTAMWPFDLILADHWWHFTKKFIGKIAR